MKDTIITNLNKADLKLKGIPEGMPVVSCPFSNFGDLETKLITQKYRCLFPAVHWGLDAPIDAETALSVGVNPNKYFVVEESEPTFVCSGVVDIERKFSTLPKGYSEYNSQVINYPGVSQAYIATGTTTFPFVYKGYDVNRKCIKLFIGEEYARKYIAISIKRTIKNDRYVNADVSEYTHHGLVADDGIVYMSVLGDYLFSVEKTSIMLTAVQTSYLYEIKSLTLLDYYLPARSTFATAGRLMIQNRFVKITNHTDFATIPIESPYMDDWSVLLSGAARIEYAKKVQMLEPLVYNYPSITKWYGHIYQIRTTYVIAQ